MRSGLALVSIVAAALTGLACDPTKLFDEPDHLEAVAPPAADPPVRISEEDRASRDFAAEKLGFRPHEDGYVYVDPAARFAANLAADGTIAFIDAPREDPSDDEGLRISGPADWASRASGAHAGAAKLELIEESAWLREQMSVQWHEDRVARHLAQLDEDLERIWGKGQATPAQRRQTIFERWDECEEEPVPALSVEEAAQRVDELRARAGMRARAEIESFIRRELASGSANAYTPEELAALNERRESRALFEPYAGAGTAD